ncbi:MAG: sigma-70 family RNA polymerase sigma factor, partial [Actinobacteria bacterium]|nr:sigma-70 family RNA polymerase sigma factor [Actinomycetota bacterium]
MAALRIEEPRAAFEPNEASADDKDLTLSFQRGDSEAYRHIYDHYASTVRGVCWRMLRDKDDAQEATQETFLRVYQALGRFNGRYQLGPWITRIATNVCLDQLRGRNCRPQAATSIDDMATELPGDQLTPEEAYLSKLESSRVREVLDTMPSTHRAAIILREFEGLSYREIALALGASETQVKALIHRARKRFKSSWAGRVSVLWPSALLHRLRGRAAPVGGSATDFVSSAASPVTLATPTTSGVFQQITTAVAERLAPALTAAVVGTTAVAGV